MNTEKYFAFISYSRKDLDVANSIYRRLESFRYPSNVEKQYRPKTSKYVKEIFLDRTRLEFSQKSFREEIRQALSQSRYLIVICSEYSAVSNEVNDEILYFLAQHGGDYGLIVPVLLDGVRVLPPSINTEAIWTRNNPICLRQNDAASVRKRPPVSEMGMDSTVAEVLTYLFHMGDSSFLYRRLNSQRLRRFRVIAAISGGCAILFCVLFFAALILKSQADRNRKMADANAREAERQSQKAIANAKEAKRQAKLAIDNAKEAKRQAKLAIDNAQAAERERKLATQSLDFMIDTFKMSDPLSAGQYDVRMIDVLKNRIPDIARLEPWELRADVGCQVGSLLHNVGLFHEATNLLFTTMTLNQSRRPQSHETAYTLYCISWCFFKDMYDTASALSYAKSALSIYENSPRQDRLKIAMVCNAIGVFYMDRDEDLSKARTYLNRAFEIRQAELGDNHADVAVVCCNLGHLYAREKAFELAGKTFNKAIQIYVHNGNTSHIGLAKAWRGLGLVYFNSQEYEKAAAPFKKALEMQMKLAGRDSRHVMNLYRELGFTYRELGEYSKALDSLEKALDVARGMARKDNNAATRKIKKDHEGYVKAVKWLIQRSKEKK